jgi:hypothetical protein
MADEKTTRGRKQDSDRVAGSYRPLAPFKEGQYSPELGGGAAALQSAATAPPEISLPIWRHMSERPDAWLLDNGPHGSCGRHRAGHGGRGGLGKPCCQGEAGWNGNAALHCQAETLPSCVSYPQTERVLAAPRVRSTVSAESRSDRPGLCAGERSLEYLSRKK